MKRPLNELDILRFVKNLPYFRGIFSRNQLPKSKKQRECGVINLDDSQGQGTHWTAYYKLNNKQCYYFDSFGNLQPPIEFIEYIGEKCQTYYNYKNYQDYDTYICGHLCIEFLYEMSNK